jgi:hypothetical protein
MPMQPFRALSIAISRTGWISFNRIIIALQHCLFNELVIIRRAYGQLLRAYFCSTHRAHFKPVQIHSNDSTTPALRRLPPVEQ